VLKNTKWPKHPGRPKNGYAEVARIRHKQATPGISNPPGTPNGTGAAEADGDLAIADYGRDVKRKSSYINAHGTSTAGWVTKAKRGHQSVLAFT